MKIQLNEMQKSLHERAVYLSSRHDEIGFARVENLIEIEANEVNKAFGKKMFNYATEVLGMDPGLAYPYIAVARACVKFSGLREALKSKKLTVTKAGRIVSVLNKNNAEELVQFAQVHSKSAIEEEVIKRNPKARSRDRIRSLNPEYDELKVAIKKTVSKNLRRVHALNPSRDLAEVTEELIEFYLNHKDPVRKAERAHARAAMRATAAAKSTKKHGEAPQIGASANALLEENSTPKPVKPHFPGDGTTHVRPKFHLQQKNSARAESQKRVTLTAQQNHLVNARDRRCCTFVDFQGQRCNNDRWTEIHHIDPVSEVGANDPSNLTTLCSFHHDLVHQLSLPIEGQVNWLWPKVVNNTDDAYAAD